MNVLSRVALVLALSACQPAAKPPEPAHDMAPMTGMASGPAADGPAVTVGAITVAQAIARPPLGGQTTGVAYLVIRNDGDAPDRLVSVASAVADPVEIHTHRNDNGVMRMARVDGVDVPAHGQVTFEPHGLHLMLFKFAPTGPAAPLTLHFEKAGDVAVDFPVTPLGADATP